MPPKYDVCVCIWTQFQCAYMCFFGTFLLPSTYLFTKLRLRVHAHTQCVPVQTNTTVECVSRLCVRTAELPGGKLQVHTQSDRSPSRTIPPLIVRLCVCIWTRSQRMHSLYVFSTFFVRFWNNNFSIYFNSLSCVYARLQGVPVWKNAALEYIFLAYA